jgi:hypothetical protein
MDQKRQSRRRPTRRRVLWAGGIVGALTAWILICIVLFGWIGLVVGPVVIALGAFWFFVSSGRSTPSLSATSGGDGFRTLLERWSGSAAIGAGILALTAVLCDWLPEDMWRLRTVLYPSFFGLSLMLMAVALPGLQTRQAGRLGRLGRAGFIVTMLGVFPLTVFLVLIAVAGAFPKSATSVWLWSWSQVLPGVLFFGGGAATLAGIALFGIATARANVLPRWAAVMFTLGLPIGIASGVLYALYLLPEATDNPTTAVWRVADIIGLGIFAIGLIGMGNRLFAHRRLKKNLSKQLLPELSRAHAPRTRMPRTGFADKTVWDWLQLLIVPIVLAVASFAFTLQQDMRQQATEDLRTQETALDAYLDKIGELMLKEDAPLRESEEGDEVNTLARSRILTVLSRLDSERKARVVQFLYESRLIAKGHPVLALHGADLSEAPLTNADLSGAYLRGVELRSANLKNADLSDADLSKADPSGADLRSTNLKNANLSDADLSEADLSDPDQEANLSGANLVL